MDNKTRLLIEKYIGNSLDESITSTIKSAIKTFKGGSIETIKKHAQEFATLIKKNNIEKEFLTKFNSIFKTNIRNIDDVFKYKVSENKELNESLFDKVYFSLMGLGAIAGLGELIRWITASVIAGGTTTMPNVVVVLVGFAIFVLMGAGRAIVEK